MKTIIFALSVLSGGLLKADGACDGPFLRGIRLFNHKNKKLEVVLTCPDGHLSVNLFDDIKNNKNTKTLYPKDAEIKVYKVKVEKKRPQGYLASWLRSPETVVEEEEVPVSKFTFRTNILPTVLGVREGYPINELGAGLINMQQSKKGTVVFSTLAQQKTALNKLLKNPSFFNDIIPFIASILAKWGLSNDEIENVIMQLLDNLS